MSLLIANKAPDFKAVAVMNDNSINENFILSEYLSGHKGIIFFYPLNFTFVCPSEIIAFNKKIQDFQMRKTKVLAVSVDSHFSHLAYKNTKIDEGGIGKINFPLVSDISQDISRSYNVLTNQYVACRGTFLIDKNFTIRHQVVNDLSLGRNVEETIRMIDALESYEKYGDVCPANWKPGKSMIKTNTDGIKDYLKNHLDEI